MPSSFPIILKADYRFPYEIAAFNTTSVSAEKIITKSWLPPWLAPHIHILDLYQRSFSADIILGNRRTTLILGLLFQFYKPKRVSLIGYEMVFNFRDNNLRNRLVILLWKIAMRKIDRLIIQSKEEQSYLAQLFSILPHRFATIPFLSEKAPFIGPSPEGYIFSAGRMERDFVSLLLAVKDTNLPAVIVADKVLDEKLAPMVTSNIRLLFNIPKDHYLTLLKKAKIVVVSLKPGFVSRGHVVLLEAMRYGKPVIFTHITGAEEYITHGSTGWLIPPNSPKKLSKLLLTLFRDLPFLNRVGRQAYEEQRTRFSPEVFYHNYQQVIHEVYSNKLVSEKAVESEFTSFPNSS